ncbi:MAG: DUF2779 domain-containing protein, partial [Candidatus Bathyarchaeota archaeon]
MMNEKGKLPTLSKSRFMAGVQCHKRLFLECYNNDLADPVDAGRQAILDSGTDVGILARSLYSGGILIDADFMHFREALKTTKEALARKELSPLYEAAFQYDDVRTRVDILNPELGSAFSLIEVKSSSSLKDEYVFDAAIQYYVLIGAGIKVTQVCLAHLNKDYVYPGGEYDLNQLFTIEDITHQVKDMQTEIKNSLAMMRICLSESEPPEIKTGKQCKQPYQCNFYGYCHQDEPEHPINQLPRISEKLLQALGDDGINDIRSIPDNFTGLNALQQRVRDCLVNDIMYLDKGIQIELSQLVYPIHFLD